ncbi:MAG: Uncharacterised protein [Flavobacteriaceae bacterium]|jgi:hypothetical protein|nr:MAG: Uncharacterised protein [Flavobacteriaceae bacterium]|tara:strand:- start:2022 stop:2510 length:489 start_codon:yes stop_codon:yes gene_type:complete
MKNKYKIIRFKTNPINLERRESYMPNSKYWNKLYEICKLYSNAKRLGINYENQTDDTFIKMMNTPTVLRNCNLMYLPISLDASKFIETEKIFPYVDSLVKRSKPQYLMLSKQYVLIDYKKQGDIESLTVVEYKRLEALLNNKRVKEYNIEVKYSDLEIIEQL